MNPTRAFPALLTLAAALALAGCTTRDAAPGTAAGATPDAQGRCAALAGRALGHGAASVEDAALVAASAGAPEYCVAHVRFADSELRIEAKLPTSGWNRKLAFLGGGGYDGKFTAGNEPYVSESVASARYATLATNGGHDYPGAPGLDYFAATFASDGQKLADFTFASEHRALPVGKELIAAYLGAPPEKSYFEGCSMGGHDALIEAQRFPNDFDGIVARAPAGNIIGLFLQFHRVARLARAPEHALDDAQRKRLADAVLARCDATDGAKDGIVSRPLQCDFDAKALRCAAGQPAAGCLGDAQLAFVEAMTTPVATRDGRWTHPGYPFGGEDQPKGWAEYAYASPAIGGQSLQGLFSDGFVRAFVTRDPAYDTTRWNPDDWTAALDLVGALFDAGGADLRPFAASGGKLILWNGTTDTSVSVRDTVAWHERAAASLGAAAPDTVELFLAPGVGHCFGGVGPDRVDLLAAMDRWVVSGVAPSAQKLEHRRLDANGTVVAARPLCPWPAYARPRAGSPGAAAADFECVRD